MMPVPLTRPTWLDTLAVKEPFKTEAAAAAKKLALLQDVAKYGEVSRDAVAATALADLEMPLVNNVDAKPLRRLAEVRESLIRQLPSPVLWEDSVRVMWEMGVRTFIEVGPGTVLTGLAKRIVPEAVTLNVQDPKSLETTVKTLSVNREA